MQFSLRKFALKMKSVSRIGLILLCPLVLVNCSCSPRPPEKALRCQPASCSFEDDRCNVQMEFIIHNPGQSNEFVSVLPMGKDNYIERRYEQRNNGLGTWAVVHYTFAFNPLDAVDGVFSYSATVRSQDDNSLETCTGEVPVKGERPVLTVALETSSVVVDTESGPVPLPNYVVGGNHAASVDAVWSANEPDWEIVEGDGGEQLLRYAGTAPEASSPSAATLRVSTTGPNGVAVTEAAALSARYVDWGLAVSQAYALPGAEITATYRGREADGETAENGATWTLLLTREDGETVDRSSKLFATSAPDERAFVADEVGRYTVKRTGAADDAEAASVSESSETVTVVEPALNVVVSPAAEDINRNEPVLFDASGSTVPPGAEISWLVTASPSESSAQMDYVDAVGKQATLTPDVMAGSYTVEARLWMPSRSEPLVSEKTFTFTSTPSAGPAVEETDYLVGEKVSFNPVNSDYPPGSTFEYVLRSVPEGSSAELVVSDDGTEASLLTDVAGVYEVALTITNSEGESSSHTTSVTAEESDAVALTLASDLPVVDDDGDLQVIRIDISEDNRLTASAAEPAVGPDTALFLYGYWSSEGTANLYDSSGAPFALVNFENGVVLSEGQQHVIQLQRDDGVYFQVALTFSAGVLEGDATVTGLSGYQCGESLRHCP